MKNRKRQVYLVDRSVQGYLMLRFAGYWVLCLAVMFGLLAAFPIILTVLFPFGERPTLTQILAGTWATLWPAMMASLLILPAVLWDLVRSSNRFVGPVCRLRRSMRALADGEDVGPVHFREGDFWFDFAEDFNRVVAVARSSGLVEPDQSEQLAKPASAAECELGEALVEPEALVEA